jgi:predicted pyridoxine 5'-phosphate oxidase superfamily flavin-nucleotide-binding protein
MKIPKYIQKVINEQGLYVLGTSSKDKMPNLIYVKFLKIYNDSQILIADNKFFKTEKNLKDNSQISFIILDKDNGKSYQLKGNVEVYKNGPIFEETVKWVEELRSGPTIQTKSAVILNIEEVYSGANKILN